MVVHGKEKFVSNLIRCPCIKNKQLTVTSAVHMVRQTKPLSWPLVITTTRTLANEINKDTTDATNVRRANLYSLDLLQFALEVSPTLINGAMNSQVRYKLRSYTNKH